MAVSKLPMRQLTITYFRVLKCLLSKLPMRQLTGFSAFTG